MAFLACQHYHLLLHPNQEITLVSNLTRVCWIWRRGIKATQGTGTWPLGPINASSNLNFSRPSLIFKRPVLSISSALSMAADVMGHNSIKRGKTGIMEDMDVAHWVFKGSKMWIIDEKYCGLCSEAKDHFYYITHKLTYILTELLKTSFNILVMITNMSVCCYVDTNKPRLLPFLFPSVHIK